MKLWVYLIVLTAALALIVAGNAEKTGDITSDQYTLISVVVRIIITAWYAAAEHKIARWLPWWRRYMPIPIMSIWTCRLAVTGIQDDALDLALTGAAIAISWWNGWTARRNKRNGDDHKAKEVAEQQLTEVQTRSYRQQVAEARA